MMNRLAYFLFFIVTIFVTSCDSDRVYENNIDMDENNWKKEDTLKFEFDITDANPAYNLYYNVRYTNNYPNYNLFTKHFIYDSAGTAIKFTRIPEDMYLFDLKTGKPYGTGLGDIYDQRISFAKDFKFPKPGKYKVHVVQYMRKEPLPGVVSFGIRVENASETSK